MKTSVKFGAIVGFFGILFSILTPIEANAKPTFQYTCFYHYSTIETNFAGNSFVRIYPYKVPGGTGEVQYKFYNTDLLWYEMTGVKLTSFNGAAETYNAELPWISHVVYTVKGKNPNRIIDQGTIFPNLNCYPN